MNDKKKGAQEDSRRSKKGLKWAPAQGLFMGCLTATMKAVRSLWKASHAPLPTTKAVRPPWMASRAPLLAMEAVKPLKQPLAGTLVPATLFLPIFILLKDLK